MIGEDMGRRLIEGQLLNITLCTFLLRLPEYIMGEGQGMSCVASQLASHSPGWLASPKLLLSNCHIKGSSVQLQVKQTRGYHPYMNLSILDVQTLLQGGDLQVQAEIWLSFVAISHSRSIEAASGSIGKFGRGSMQDIEFYQPLCP